MGGTAVRIDVQAVGVVVHHMGLRAQGIKHILGNGGRAAVGTVQGHLHVLKGTGCNGNQITDVAVASGRKVHGAAYVLFSCQGDFADFPIQVFFNLQDNGFFQLLASFIDYLDTVVIEWIMACGYHDPAVKPFRAYHIGYAGGGGHMEQVHIGAGSSKACNQGILEHVAAAPGILPNHHTAPLVRRLLPIVPSKETPHFIGVFHSQIHIGLSAETIRTKIFTHCLLIPPCL